ncbi:MULTISPECIES: DNA integrity scanning diadenylate cyclase DisA [Bacillaceae]|uniref:DNA integrity scanning diadenylate cyclase DisA n=1 Tax=Bacillales TaxID=1385 RepID=UPI001883F919|nr:MULTISPECIES: DNA integrity scanning diadenylate cyclase DisA [Bacillaceae]MBF0707162.1 DNA integrity scanning protein DisA [Pseudalkalibacillus hwajinpoensis]MDO6658435.1 DNA integrity scanning diadenylate cyclase DisA [Anaerobacillus sp. 1_MG-2023]WLR58071.1 DNA integrity scanning diadenylate cyclase DisA [Pseudalkalibacillus hwajinpoensis]
MEIDKQQEIINEILKIVAPGTQLRHGIDNILRANTGGLIVVGYDGKLQDIVDGGFSIECRFTPAYLYELAKMDGAIILNKEASKILYANTQLIPETSIPSTETGIRHRTAERVAKQTGNLVISISQRRNVITLYQGSIRYSLKEIGVILTKANQAMQTLEKYKSVLDQGITDLGALEFEELVTLQEVAQVIHRIEMVLRIKKEILNYINELGTEGRLISMQMEELVSNLESEAKWLIGDYVKDVDESPADVMKRLKKLSSDDLLEDNAIMRILGYHDQNENVAPRGYRILHKIPRLPSNIIENLVDSFENLNAISKASIEELDHVDGIGAIRAKKIKDGLKRIQEQLFVDRHI